MQEKVPSEDTSDEVTNLRLSEEIFYRNNINAPLPLSNEAASKDFKSKSLKEATNNDLHNDTHKNKSCIRNIVNSSYSRTVNKKRKLTVGNFALANIIKDTIRTRDRMDFKERKLADQKLNDLQERKLSNT